MRLMEVTDVLMGRDVADFSQLAAVHNLLDGLVERAVAQNMADGNHPVFLVRFFLQFDTFGQLRRNRFFQQNVVALFQSCQRHRNVLSVLGADKHQICQLWLFEHLLGAVKAHLLRQIKQLFCRIHLFTDDVRHCMPSGCSNVYWE